MAGDINSLNLLVSQIIGPIEVIFLVKTPYAKLVKIYMKYFGHVTKMAATPTLVKTL